MATDVTYDPPFPPIYPPWPFSTDVIYGRDHLSTTIKFIRADTFVFDASVILNASAVDISTWEITMSVKYDVRDTEYVFQKYLGNGVVILDGPAGQFRVNIDPHDTQGLPAHRMTLPFDIQGNTPDGKQYTLLYGNLVVDPDVTYTVPCSAADCKILTLKNLTQVDDVYTYTGLELLSVFRNGVQQEPNVDYTVFANVITPVEAWDPTDVVSALISDWKPCPPPDPSVPGICGNLIPITFTENVDNTWTTATAGTIFLVFRNGVAQTAGIDFTLDDLTITPIGSPWDSSDLVTGLSRP